MLRALAIGTALAVLLLVGAEVRNRPIGRRWWKTLASLGFVTIGGLRLCSLAAPTRFDYAVLAALVLSLVGDVLLIEESTFLLGLGSFLCGHLAFSIAFVMRGVAWPTVLVAGVPVALITVVIAGWLLPHVKGAMRAPVMAYMVVISSMVALSIGTVSAHGQWVLVLAASTFFLSDLSVARDRFVKKEPLNRVWGLPLYYGAQLLFAWTIGAS